MSMEEERERQAREQRAREEAEGKTNLESVPEEGKEGESSETQPLLDAQGEASGADAEGSGVVDAAVKKEDPEEQRREEVRNEGEEKKGEDVDRFGDRMDTA